MKAAFDAAMIGETVQIERSGIVYQLQRAGWVVKSEKLKDLLITDFKPGKKGFQIEAEIYEPKTCKNGHLIPEGRNKCDWKGCKYG